MTDRNTRRVACCLLSAATLITSGCMTGRPSAAVTRFVNAVQPPSSNATGPHPDRLAREIVIDRQSARVADDATRSSECHSSLIPVDTDTGCRNGKPALPLETDLTI